MTSISTFKCFSKDADAWCFVELSKEGSQQSKPFMDMLLNFIQMANEKFCVFWKISVSIILSQDIWSTKLVNSLFWFYAFHEGVNVMSLIYFKVASADQVHSLTYVWAKVRVRWVGALRHVFDFLPNSVNLSFALNDLVNAYIAARDFMLLS